MKKANLISSVKQGKSSFMQKIALFIGLFGVFSNLHAQDLCAEFGQVNLTRPSINNGVTSSIGTELIDEVLEISGTFTVNGPFKFERCTIRMTPNAVINVTSTEEFEVLDCVLYTCNGMWNGIRLPNQGRLSFWRNELEDATTGLDITNPKYCLIHNNHFNSNDVSILIKDYNGVCSFGIAGNHFNENWVNMNNNSSITNLVTQSFTAFRLINCSSRVPIGLSGYPRNVIHGSTGLGVFSDASKVCLSNTQIGLSNTFFIGVGYPNQIGVLAQNNSEVCIHGLGSSPTSDLTFTRAMQAAVLADNSNLRCYHISAKSSFRHGIWVRNTQSHWFDISNNRIQGGYIVPILAEKGTSGVSWINGNIIEPQEPNHVQRNGIRVVDVSNSQAAISVDHNQVTIRASATSTNESRGIEFLSGNSSNNYMRGNHLFITGVGPGIASGIHFTSSNFGLPGDENRIQNNYIGESGVHFTRGINIVSTPNAFVCGNQLIQATTGIRFNENCMNTEVGTNVFSGTGAIGLSLDGNGINLGTNGINNHKGNRWEGTYSNLAARHSGTDPQLSPFRVNDNPNLECGNLDYWPNSNGTPSVTANWFTSESGCLQGCGIQTLVGGNGGDLDLLDNAIIDGTYAQTGQSPASDWNARYSAYQKIVNNPNVFGNNAVAANFVETMRGSSIAGLYAVENLISRALNMPASIEVNLQALYDQSKTQHDVVEAALIAHLADPKDEALESAYFAALSANNQIYAQISALIALGDQEKSANLAQAEALESQMLPGNDFEMYMKNVTNLRIKWLNNQLDAESEKSELLEIAMKCYEEAGQAIYFARAMLMNMDTTEYVFPSDEFCIEERINHSSSTRLQLSIYPNPVSSELIVNGLGDTKGPIICTIFDLLGSEVQHTTLTGTSTIPFQTINPGAYVLRLMTTDGQLLGIQKVIKVVN